MIVYLLTFSSGKKYIGQTRRTIGHRLAAHRLRQKQNHTAPVYEEWRKWGEPVVETLEECSSLESLHEAEQKWIRLENTVWPEGLNLALGGMESSSKHAEAARRISVAATGRKYSDETKAKVSENTKKLWADPEYRAKVAAGVAESYTDQRKEKVSAGVKKAWKERLDNGWKMSDSTKEKLSKRVISDEQRRKMSESAKNRVRQPRSQETKDKIAAKTKAFWANASAEQIAQRCAQICDGFKKSKPD